MKIENSTHHRKVIADLARDLGLRVEVAGHGKLDCKVAVIGEYPGQREVELGIPFSGSSGKILWSAMSVAGFKRTDVYCTNVIKRRLLETDKGKKIISNNEADAWKQLLLHEIELMPNIEYILVLGSRALQVITGNDKITDWRGSVIDVGSPTFSIPKRVICANNPAAVLHSATNETIFGFDVAKLGRVVSGKFKEYKITYHYNLGYKAASDAIDHIHNEGRKDIPVSYDIETMSHETACIGFAVDGHEGFCINFRNRSDNLFSTREEVLLRLRIAKLLGDKGVRRVAQNGHFDAHFLGYKDKIVVPNNWFDTLLAHHTLYSGLPHNLGFLVSQYTDHPFYKDEGDEWKEGGDIDTFWEYNIKDACLTWEIHKLLHEELDLASQDDFFFNHVMRLQPHLIPITICGLRIDTELKETIKSDLERDIDVAMQKFYKLVHELTDDEHYFPNIKSPSQMRELYFQRLRLIGRGMSTNAENRYRMRTGGLASDKQQELLLLVDDIAEQQKFYGTYAKMRLDEDGRARTEYKQYGTTQAPGRLSSSKTLWDTGMNMQNQPEKAHPMFIADEGDEFGYFDLSQAEARYVGWDAQLEDWIADFERARLDQSYDCHRALASTMFDTPYELVPVYDRDEDGKITIRFIAKRCRHGLNYRMGPDRLATTTKLPLAECIQHYNTYHRVNPGLRVWWNDIEAEFRQNRVLFNYYGRRLIHLGRLDDDALRSIVAFKPQSSIGDKVNRTIYLSQEDPRWPTGRARIMLNIHDALIVQSRARYTKTCLSIMKKYAEEPMIIHGRELIIPAETKISVADEQGFHRWSSLKGVEIEAAA